MARTKQEAKGAAIMKRNALLARAKLPIAKKSAPTKTSIAPLRHSKRVLKKFEPFNIAAPPQKVSKKGRKKARAKAFVGVKKIKGGKKAVKLLKRVGRDRAGTSKKKEPKKRKRAEPKEPKRRKHKNDLLQRRPEIEDLQANPFFYSKKPPKFVSVSSYGRIAHRCVFRKDLNELRRVVEDKAHFCCDALRWSFSHESQLSPEAEAILMEDKKLIEGVIALRKNLEENEDWRRDRAAVEPVLLRAEGTGQSNIHMLGHATAQIEMTRGAREGNNALVNYEHATWTTVNNFVETFFEKDVSFGILEHLTSIDHNDYRNLRSTYSTSIHMAVRYGHRQLAAKMIETYSSYNFNDLHVKTLKNTSQPLEKFLPISVLKKGRDNRNITPLHTAAINPNVAYLKALIAAEPNFNVPDLDNWYTIHYAAVCEGTGPLKFLLDKGIPVILLNKRKDTPLHCAARAGRVECVKLLIEAIRKAERAANEERENAASSSQDGAETDAEGAAGDDGEPPRKKPRSAKVKQNASLVNAKALNGYTPLHFAAEKGHEEVIRVLLAEPGIIVDAQTSAGHKKLTPLMLACQKGYRHVADILIDEGGAVVEKGDKLKRTALIHAVMNGETHVVAMLLRRGASPLVQDSSGNAPAHYAAAYGWFECLEMIARAEPSALSLKNDWDLTPLAVAYMKGHVGIVEWLVDGPYSGQVDVNCRDHVGKTLISSVINYHSIISNKQIVKQLEYLISKGADCSLTDTCKNSPLHFFASRSAKLKVDGEVEDDEKEENDSRLTREEYKHCVDLLLGSGAELDATNDNGDDPLCLALKNGNLILIEYLFDKLVENGGSLHGFGARYSDSNLNNKSNILHTLVEIPFKAYGNTNIWARRYGPTGGQYNIIPLMTKFISLDEAVLQHWLSEKDAKGRTPFLLLCQRYTTIKAAVGDYTGTGERGKYLGNLEQLLYTVCAFVRQLTGIDGRILLQKIDNIEDEGEKEESDNSRRSSSFRPSRRAHRVQLPGRSPSCFDGSNENKVNEEKNEKRPRHMNAISYGLIGNDVHHRVAYSFNTKLGEIKIRNKLLVTMVEMAKEKGILWELLSQRDADDFTPLLYSVRNNDLVTSIYLLSLRPPPNKRNLCQLDAAVVTRRYNDKKQTYVPYNKSVLMYAIERLMFALIEELELTDAEWNACTASGSNAFHFAAKIVSSKTVDCFELLKKKGVEIKANNAGRYPLHIAVDAVRSGGADVLTEPVEWLIAEKKGLHERDEDNRLPLHYAFVSKGDIELSDDSTMDPIGIVSLLELAMDKDKIDTADKLGNTALHYAALRGATVCMVTLLRYGCDVNALNLDGNSPLGIAVLHQKETCALTLIQANSEVVAQVYSRVPPRDKEREDWVWVPKRSKPPPKDNVSSVISLVVRNGWQGIIYIILDLLGKSVATVGELVLAAVEHRKYNLVQTLLRSLAKIVNTGSQQEREQKRKSLDSIQIFLVFVKNLVATQMDETIRRVFDQLIALGIKWYSVDANSEDLKSQVVEHLARRGHFEMLEAIQQADASSGDSKWELVKYDNGNNNPLVGVVEAFIQNGSSDEAKKWMTIFGKKFGINTLMNYDLPAFEGMEPWMVKQPIADTRKMTPLIRAIQCRNVPLVRFLLQNSDLRVDVNLPDEVGITPLMHACLVNSEAIVRLLFDPQCMNSDPAPSSQVPTTSAMFGLPKPRGLKRKNMHQNSGIGGIFGGFGVAPGGSSAMLPTALNSTEAETRESENEIDSSTVVGPVKLKSDLDIFGVQLKRGPQSSKVNAAKNAKTFLHYMISPCGWENVDMLNMICKGVPEVIGLINKPLSGIGAAGMETPIMAAKNACQAEMLKAMKKLTKTSGLEIEMPVVDVSGIATMFDVDSDSKNFLDRDSQRRAAISQKELAKRRRTPHEKSGYEKTGEICVVRSNDPNNDNEQLYKVLMTKTDTQYGTYGFHNFYRMELIQRKGSELYILFTNWGRVGDQYGQYQRTPFGSFAEAEKEFCSIFRAKSGNEFANIANFIEKPKKYRLVKVDPNQIYDITDLKIDLDSSPAIDKKRFKEDSVYKFIRDVSNVKRLQERAQTVCSYSRLNIPFGRLSRSNILEARKILLKLRDLLTELDEIRKYNKGTDEALRVLRALADGSNDFYQLMPFGGFENDALPVIDSDNIFEEFEKTLENLLEFEVAGKTVTAAAEKSATVDPYLYIMDALECEISLMDPNDLMAQRILQYIQNSSSCRVKGIYTIKSKDATQLFNESALEVPNHRYLWHGTKPENLLSILRLGLLATPPTSVQTGQAFGKGIYFADIFAKSEGYCTCSNAGLKYALLCQVALGEIFYGQDSNCIRASDGSGKRKMAAYDTLKVVGTTIPDPLYDMTLENGAVLPLGPLKNLDREEINRQFGFYTYVDKSEYIVRDKSLTVVRYLVAFE